MASAAVAAAKEVGKLLQNVHLRPVKDIIFTFNPFVGNVFSISLETIPIAPKDLIFGDGHQVSNKDNLKKEQSLFHLNSSRILTTNPKVNMKIEVKSNLCDPTMKVNFNDGVSVLYKTNNLSTLEIMEHLSQLLDAKDIKKEETFVLTKTEKKKKK